MIDAGAVGQLVSFYSQARKQLFDVLERPSVKGRWAET
jgi:hypothetical protein